MGEVEAVPEQVYTDKGGVRSKLILTCEHASQRIPAPWEWQEDDKQFMNTHWAIDIGARELTLELAERLQCPAVLAR